MDNLGCSLTKGESMLEGKQVRLRKIEEVDLPKLRDWRNSPYIRAYTREYRPLNMLNQNKWFSSLLIDQTKVMFVIEKKEDSELVGCCGLTYINWKEGHGKYLSILENRNGRKRDMRVMLFNFYSNMDFAS